MSILQFKRGTTAQVAAQTPAAGEFLLDTTLLQILIGDGSTQGGNPLTVVSAPKLTTSRTFRVNLASTTAVSFDGSANVTPGVTGILPITNGGTGAATVAAARSALSAAVSGANSDITSLTGLTGVSPLVGVSDGSDAVSGKIGEYLSATSSATTVTSAQSTTLASLTLTPGDWEVEGVVQFVPSGGTNNWTQMHSSIQVGSTTAVFPYLHQIRAQINANGGQHLPAPKRRVSISANTTVYVEGGCTFPDGTMQLTGFIQARRVR